MKLLPVLALVPLCGCAQVFDSITRLTPGSAAYARAYESQKRWEAIYYRRSLMDQRAYVVAIRDNTSDEQYAKALTEQIAALDQLLAQSQDR